MPGFVRGIAGFACGSQPENVAGRDKPGLDVDQCGGGFYRSALHAHRDTHAVADAQRGEAFLGVAPLHLVEQRHQYARAGGVDRMTKGAVIDVDLFRVPAEVLVDRADLRSERLVGPFLEPGFAYLTCLKGDSIMVTAPVAAFVNASPRPLACSARALN